MVERFTAALQGGSMAELDRLSTSKIASGAGWQDVSDFLERNACIAFGPVAWTLVEADERSATVDVTSNWGILRRGSVHSILETKWRLKLARPADEWLVEAASRRERVVARELAADPANAEALLALHQDLDLGAIAMALAEHVATPAYAGKAGASLDYALALARRAGDPAAESHVLQMTASAFTYADAPDRALAAARSALTVARDSGNLDVTTAALFRVAIRDRDLTISGLRETAAMADRLQDPRIALRAQTVLTSVLMDRGDFPRAAIEAEKLRTLSAEHGWTEGELNALIQIGGTEAVIGDYEPSLRNTRVALARATANRNDRVAAMALNNILFGLERAGRKEEALEILDRSMRLGALHFHIPYERARFMLRFIKLLGNLGRFSEAEALAAENDELLRKKEAREVRLMFISVLGNLRLRQGQSEEALAIVTDATNFAGSDDYPAAHAAASTVAGQALRNLRRDEEAIRSFEHAIALTENQLELLGGNEVTRASYFEEQVLPYLELIDLLVEHGRAADAFLLSERMKGRALRDVSEHGRVNLSAAMSAAERKQEDELQRAVTALAKNVLNAGDSVRGELQAQLEAARVDLRSFLTRLYLAKPALRVRRSDTRDQTVAPSPETGTVFVSFVVGRTATFRFLVTRGTDGAAVVRATRIPIDEERLTEKVQAFSRMIRGRDLGYRKTALELYALLLADAEPVLRGHTTAVISPHGPLWLVPFATLAPASQRPRLSELAMVSTPSIHYAVHPARQRGGGRPALLAFGNPDVAATPVSQFPPLADAEKEVAAIRALYGADRSRVYIRDKARESTFKSEAPAYDVLHIATHTLMNDRAPLHSGLLLSAEGADAADDGILEAREILDLRLQADLAVLSACETGVGRVGAGEGVIGLSWAFHVAGCATTVVSQWKTDSRATSILITEFHRNLVEEHRSPAEALRRAQLFLMREPRYAHPFYWAPFIVVGRP